MVTGQNSFMKPAKHERQNMGEGGPVRDTAYYYYYYYYYYSIWMSLVTGLFFLVLLLNQR